MMHRCYTKSNGLPLRKRESMTKIADEKGDTRMKVITSAIIEVVKFSELTTGDNILWGNWKRKVMRINRKERTVLVDDPYGDKIEELNAFMNYYVIKSCEETEIYMD